MNTGTLGHEARNNLRYFAEMLGAVVVLAAAKIVARHLPVAPGTTAYTVIQLLPVPAVWLIPLTMLRHYLRIDELERLLFLQSIALTGGILAGIAWSLPSLHGAFGWNTAENGMWEVYFSVIFLVATALVNLRARAG